MKLKIKGSHLMAAAIVLGLGLWMLEGTLVIGGQKHEEDAKPTIAERTAKEEGKRFKVSVVEINPTQRQQVISVRGRTKADAIIPIRAETGGILQKRMVERGDRVSEGDLICVIESGARESMLASARASLEKAQAEYEANQKLSKKGYATKNHLKQMKAGLDAAKAQVKEAETELSRVEVRSNASGIVQDPIAQEGDMLSAGGTCITLNDSDPMYFTGQVSERDIGLIKPGMKAVVILISNAKVNGEIDYLSPSADYQTRTFPIEIRLSDNSENIRDGMTATAKIKLPETDAFKISPAWLTLAEDGEIGVKVVDDSDKVMFKPVKLLSQSNEGFWVSGLEKGDRVITLGQEYVVSGETVSPKPDQLFKAELQN